jgi:hypothetical protein
VQGCSSADVVTAYRAGLLGMYGLKEKLLKHSDFSYCSIFGYTETSLEILKNSPKITQIAVDLSVRLIFPLVSRSSKLKWYNENKLF